MSKLTTFNNNFPSRISVTFETHIDKYVISKIDDETIKVELNRNVLKGIDTMNKILTHFKVLIGVMSVEQPNFRYNPNDWVFAEIDNKIYQGKVLSHGILNNNGIYLYLCHVQENGTIYVPENKLSFRRRINPNSALENITFIPFCGERIKRISIALDSGKTNKYVLEYNNKLRVFYNRKITNFSNLAAICDDIYKLFNINKPIITTNLRKNDRVRVCYEYKNNFEFEQSIIAQNPILDVYGNCVAPCFVSRLGMAFINTSDIKRLDSYK